MAIGETDKGATAKTAPEQFARSQDNHVHLEGFARLHLPGGQSIPVVATLNASRTFFGNEGSGHFLTSDGAAISSAEISAPLSLVFGGAKAFLIEVKEARWGVDGCKCHFVVFA